MTGFVKEDLLLDALDSLLASAYLLKTVVKSDINTRCKIENPSFNWSLFNEIISEINNETTNLTMGFGVDSDSTKLELCRKMQKPIETLAQFVNNSMRIAGETLGKTLTIQLQAGLSHLADSLVKLVVLLKTENGQRKKSLLNTGLVWEKCDFVGNLAQTPTSALLLIIYQQIDLINDVVGELGGSTVEKTEFKAIFVAILGLVKCAQSFLSMLKNSVQRDVSDRQSLDVINSVDNLADLLAKFSESVDDLVTELYQVEQRSIFERTDGQSDVESLNDCVDSLHQLLTNLLRLFVDSVYFSHSDDRQKVDFLFGAFDHNRNKFRKSLDHSFICDRFSDAVHLCE